MKKLKRFLPLTMILSLSLLGACSSGGDGGTSNSSSSSSSSSSTSEAAPFVAKPVDEIQIGVVQLAEHPALDQATEGFIDVLLEAGFLESNIEIQNAQGEQANCSTIATKFVNDNVDLVLAVATPAAQSMSGATSSIPILATAVTDFEVAGLTANNVTGVSDMGPIEGQIELLLEIVPDPGSVGILYCSSEDNSIMQADIAKEILQEHGINPVVYTVAESSEVQQATQAAVNTVGAIYIPTDNLLAQTMATVALVANPAQIPVIVGESGMVDSGGLATLGVDYYSLGAQTAQQALKILVDGVDIATMPVEFSLASDWTPSYNQDTFDALGLEVPESLLG